MYLNDLLKHGQKNEKMFYSNCFRISYFEVKLQGCLQEIVVSYTNICFLHHLQHLFAFNQVDLKLKALLKDSWCLEWYKETANDKIIDKSIDTEGSSKGIIYKQ